jgi:hypothetical protein
VYSQIRLARRYRHGLFAIHALDYCVGRQTDRATVLHVRGRCDGDVAFAGCLVISEGRDEPVYDLKTYGEPRDLDALAGAVEACLDERTTVIRDEMARICGEGAKRAQRRTDR